LKLSTGAAETALLARHDPPLTLAQYLALRGIAHLGRGCACPPPRRDVLVDVFDRVLGIDPERARQLGGEQPSQALIEIVLSG